MRNRDLIAILQTRNPEHEVLIEFNQHKPIPVEFNCVLGTCNTIIALDQEIPTQTTKSIVREELHSELLKEKYPANPWFTSMTPKEFEGLKEAWAREHQPPRRIMKNGINLTQDEVEVFRGFGVRDKDGK